MSPRVLTFGEGMLRLSVPPGVRLEHTERLQVHSAGSEANVAAALAQLGLDVAWYSRLPSNPLGRKLSRDLVRYGVDVSLVTWVEDGRLGVFYVELTGPPRPISIVYDREGSTASHMTRDMFPWDAAETASLVHVSGITPAISEGCRALTLEVVDRIAESDTPLSIDVNFRAKLWSAAEARATFAEMAGKVDLMIVNREDARDVFGVVGESTTIAERLQEMMQVKTVVVSLGEKGARWRRGDSSAHVPAQEAMVVDRIGAGDAFAAGVIAGYLDGDVGQGVEMGTVMAAMALGLHGDFLSTSRDEVTGIMRPPQRSVDR